MSLIALNLLECTVTLYPSQADGSPDLTSPIWTGVTVENLVVRERWMKAETRRSGSRWPRKHPLVQQYELSLGRVWSLQLPTAGGGLVMGRGYCVLDVVWVDGDSGDWHRETFYNVTISDRSRTSRDIDGGFTDEQVFDAEYMAAPSGGTGGPGAVPAITGGLPYVVKWNAGPDAAPVDLYAYDPATHGFTEAAAGVAAPRATLAYTAGVFTLTFAGASGPAMEVGTDGSLTVTAMAVGAPDRSQVPWVEFWYGPMRVACVTSGGRLYAASFVNGAAVDGVGKFGLTGGGVLAVTLAGTGVVAAVMEA